MKLSCVLFDLDGTLADTAPDLIDSLNRSLQKHDYSPVNPAEIKPYISLGAAAMVEHSLNNSCSEQQQTSIVNAMLEIYQQNNGQHTRLFTGMAELLNMLEKNGIKWGSQRPGFVFLLFSRAREICAGESFFIKRSR